MQGMMHTRQTRAGNRDAIVMLVAFCAMLHWSAPMAGLGMARRILPAQRTHCLSPNLHSVQRAMLPVNDPQLPTPRPAPRMPVRRDAGRLALRPLARGTGDAARLMPPLRI
jgi:hypothetical protein